MPQPVPKNYIFLDESGNPEIYSANGVNLVEKNQASKYLILSAIRASDQLLLQQQITDFRAELLHDSDLTKMISSAYTLDSFHAQIDYDAVKELFYAHINALDVKINGIKCASINLSMNNLRNPKDMNTESQLL